jgi:hypothetical protein
MAVILWGSEFQNAFPVVLADGRDASVAFKREPKEIWFKVQDEEAVKVGVLESGKSAHLHERTDGILIVTNGIDKSWWSENGGRDWEVY